MMITFALGNLYDIAYKSAEGTETKRRVLVTEQFKSKEGKPCIKTLDEKRNDYRTFRVDRIEGVSIVKP